MPPEYSQPNNEASPGRAPSEPTTLEIALSLLEHGFRPIPLGGNQETPPFYFNFRNDGNITKATAEWSKTPRIKWMKYHKTVPTEDEVTHWWNNANIAILTDLEIYVIDANSKSAMGRGKRNWSQRAGEECSHEVV